VAELGKRERKMVAFPGFVLTKQFGKNGLISQYKGHSTHPSSNGDVAIKEKNCINSTSLKQNAVDNHSLDASTQADTGESCNMQLVQTLGSLKKHNILYWRI